MKDKGRVLVGVAGWSYQDWKGVVYPRRERNNLSFMARFLDCVEINSSFYRPFSARVAEKWLRDVSRNERFTFAAKLWSRFTHEVNEPYPDSAVDGVREGFAALQDAGRLSGILIQFPFHFRDARANRERLRRIAEDFAGFPGILEVRDDSWARPEALEFISGLKLSIACLDMPLTHRSFREKAVVTGPIGYLRLHGRNYETWFSKEAGRDDRYNYLYSDEELGSVLERIERLRDMAERAVVIWNNHYRGQAVVNALESLHRIRGERVEVPPLLAETYPRLREIAREQQGGLFEH